MHIPDGFVATPVNAATGILALAALGYSLRRVPKDYARKPFIVPLLALSAAFVFAAQMLNFPIGGGTSGHFLGAATIAALLGPWAACLVMAVVLTIQCLLFADGGLLALGSNLVNMGCVAGLLAFPMMRGLQFLLPKNRRGFLAAAAFTSWLSVVLASLACSIEIALSGTSPFWIVAPAMVGTHAIIGIGEAMICTAVLTSIASARPDILPPWAHYTGNEPVQALRPGRLVAAGLALSLILAVFVSPHASPDPDGLDRIAINQGFDSHERDVWRDALFPDYKIEGITQDGLSTSLAGLIGTMAVFLIGFAGIKLSYAKSESK